jgi:hypothetical protein
MHPDIPYRRRAEESIDNGMGQDIGITPSVKAAVKRNFNAAKYHFTTRYQGMNIKSNAKLHL